MAVSPSSLLSYLKASLGTIVRVCPITDDEIMRIVYNETLPTYSSFFPYYIRINVSPTTDSTDEQGIYRIRTEPNISILGIAEVLREPLNASSGSYFPPYFDSTDIFTFQAAMDLHSMCTVPTTAKFYPPDRVEVFPKYNYMYDFLLKTRCVHPRHLQTIGETMFLQFKKLALYDVRNFIFETVHTLDGLNTAFGNIDLKLDRYQSAEDDRRNLLEEFEKRYLQDAHRKKIFII